MHRISRRFLHHAVLATTSTGVCLVLYAVVPSSDPHFRWSISSAYDAFALLVLTLVIGPVNALRGRKTPVSSDLRRDIGIWAFIWSVLHTVLGLQVHMGGRISEYFFHPGTTMLLGRIRTELFGAANFTGLLAVVLTLLLVSLSNDFSLRRLGNNRWKGLQRFNYLCFAFVVAHGILYQLIEKRFSFYTFTLGFLAIIAVSLQAARTGKRWFQTQAG